MRVLGQPHLERAIVDECVMAGPNLQIAVVGGSIAGCCAAVELTRAGHHAEIFERSGGALVGQGAGIGVLADSGGLANIGCYVPVRSDALAGLLIDRNGRRHAASLAPGEVRPEEHVRFHEAA